MRALVKAALLAALLVGACANADSVEVPDHDGAMKSSAAVRAERIDVMPQFHQIISIRVLVFPHPANHDPVNSRLVVFLILGHDHGADYRGLLVVCRIGRPRLRPSS